MDMDVEDLADPRRSDRLIALDEALTELGERDRQKADLVKLHYFAGLSVEEAAQIMAIAVPAQQRGRDLEGGRLAAAGIGLVAAGALAAGIFAVDQATLPALVLGPGDIAQAHAVDEWVRLDQLSRAAGIYKSIVEHG